MSGSECDQDSERLKDRIRAQVQEHCQRTGYRLNPDRRTVDRLITALATRTRRFGEPYCPCRVMTGDPKQDKDLICPCVYHEEEIARDGICHCLLFCSPEYEADSKRPEVKHRQDRPSG